jgi:hypothetical protein
MVGALVEIREAGWYPDGRYDGRGARALRHRRWILRCTVET